MSELIFCYTFVDYGQIITSKPCKVVLDVGNNLRPGIIDHHQPTTENECTVSLICKFPEYILSNIKGCNKVELVTHKNPDLDAIGGIFFSEYLIKYKKLTNIFYKLSKYIKRIDMGLVYINPKTPFTIYSIYMGSCHIINNIKGINNYEKDLLKLEKGKEILNYIVEKEDFSEILDEEFFKKYSWFNKAKNLIEEDYEKYLKDKEKSEKIKIFLPVKNGKSGDFVNGLLIENPESMFFKVWARSENYIFLAVNFNNKRYIISVDPEKNFYLKGLGDILNKAEQEKRILNKVKIIEKNRPGYNMPDPWYDGRNKLHNYTIIDTPRNGTLLTWDEIKNIIFGYSKFISQNKS